MRARWLAKTLRYSCTGDRRIHPHLPAYYSAPVELLSDPHQVLGVLAAARPHDMDVERRQVWEEEVEILRGRSGWTCGYDLPGVNRRVLNS